MCVCDVKKKEEQEAKAVTFRGSSFFGRNCGLLRGFPSSPVVKNLPAMQGIQETWLDPGSGRSHTGSPSTAAHSSILAWRIPWAEEPGGCGPWGLKESDTTEVTEHTRRHAVT